MTSAREADPVLMNPNAVVGQWERNVGLEYDVTVADLVHLAYDARSTDDRIELRSALYAVAGAGSGIDNKKLGKWLSSVKNRTVGDGAAARQITNPPQKQSGVQRWLIRHPKSETPTTKWIRPRWEADEDLVD